MVRDTDDDFRAWVLSRRESLRRGAYLMCGDWFLADDLVQDAMAKVYAVWGRVALRGDPDAYARRVVVNLVVDHSRRPWRREVVSDLLPEPASNGRDVYAGVEAEDSDVLAALAGLPARQRATLVLRFYEDLSVEQTASVLDVSTGTVKSQTNRALRHLRSALSHNGFDVSDLIGEDVS